MDIHEQILKRLDVENLIRCKSVCVRPPLSSYPSNQQDEIRRTYIRLGPYQLVKAHYPLSPCGFHSGQVFKGGERERAYRKSRIRLIYCAQKKVSTIGERYKKPFEMKLGRQSFVLIVDESQDESKKEQMAIVVRFVDRNGYSRSSYDGASNMRREWNGLKALILNECSSTKRNDQLQDAQLAEISYLAEIGELEDERGANQMQHIKASGIHDGVHTLNPFVVMVRLFGPTRVSRNKKDDVIVEHHYRVDVFIVAIDSQLQELNNRFNESVASSS
ncbi:zinc finger MYM-type protein 1-like protein [Tanacetum coccineum]